MSRRPDDAAQVVRLHRGSPPFRITVDGASRECYEGETIATALLATGSAVAADAARPRGLWCGIGVCFECVVTVDGVPGARACLTPARPGMQVMTRVASPTEEPS